MAEAIIDLWDPTTYDEGLNGVFQQFTDVIRGYYNREQEVDAQLNAKPFGSAWVPLEPNPFEDQKAVLRDKIDSLMAARTLRTFHYTRLTDDEVSRLFEKGVELSETGNLRQRLDMRVKAGDLAQEHADFIFKSSALQSQEYGKRTGMFWSCALPYPADDHGVTRLLGMWGGEAAYWTLQQDPDYKARLGGIGVPRIVELAVPLSSVSRFGHASENMIRAYANSLGMDCNLDGMDVCCIEPLPSSSILAVHTAGDGSFELIGRS
jgi:hypothetical protein